MENLPDDLIKILYEELDQKSYKHFYLSCKHFQKIHEKTIETYFECFHCKNEDIKECIKKGHYNCFRFLYKIENIKEYICNYIAFYGHLKLLQWARENGCPWDKNTYSYAVSSGHLEILQWVIENGCPMN